MIGAARQPSGAGATGARPPSGQLVGALVLAVTIAAVVCDAALPPTTAGLVVTLAFAVVGPGWAVVGYLRIRDLAVALTMAVGLGTSLSLLCSMALLVCGWWHPLPVMLGLQVVAAVLLGHQLVAGRLAGGARVPVVGR